MLKEWSYDGDQIWGDTLDSSYLGLKFSHVFCM
jgi:hypothetical protein